MRLYGTPPSHFTRKVRVLLQELRVPYEFVSIPDLFAVGQQHFGQNPLQRFPVLEHDGTRLIESDLICEYLIDRFGAGTGFASYYPEPKNRVRDGQSIAVMNGTMDAGVNLLRGKRSGIEPWEKYPFFRQELAAIGEGLAWLEKDLGARDSYYPGRLTMPDVTLMCALEWLAFREFWTDHSKHPNLARFVAAHGGRPSFQSTHPLVTEVRS
jgi:glutathione S-transferase